MFSRLHFAGRLVRPGDVSPRRRGRPEDDAFALAPASGLYAPSYGQPDPTPSPGPGETDSGHIRGSGACGLDHVSRTVGSCASAGPLHATERERAAARSGRRVAFNAKRAASLAAVRATVEPVPRSGARLAADSGDRRDHPMRVTTDDRERGQDRASAIEAVRSGDLARGRIKCPSP